MAAKIWSSSDYPDSYLLIDLPRYARPNCLNALKSVWGCNQYKTLNGDLSMFSKCEEARSCFLYNSQFLDGTEQPLSVKNTPFCFAAAENALAQCKADCGELLIDQMKPCCGS